MLGSSSGQSSLMLDSRDDLQRRKERAQVVLDSRDKVIVSFRDTPSRDTPSEDTSSKDTSRRKELAKRTLRMISDDWKNFSTDAVVAMDDGRPPDIPASNEMDRTTDSNDADKFRPPDIPASETEKNEMDRTTQGFEEKESKVRLLFKERTEKNELQESEENEKSNEDRNIELEKTIDDIELEKNERNELKGFEEKQNEEGVQEVEEESNKQSSEENRKPTNKDRNKVCTDTAYKKYKDNISLHRRTAAKNDLIVKQILLSKLFKHKTMRQITSRLKLHGNAQVTCMGKDLYKLDQDKTDKTGQKNRHEKSTRCTWEPGIVWME